MEISLGQFWQTGDVGVFASFHKRLRGVGVSSIACGYMVITYYSMLIAWVMNAFFDSWSDDAPWTDPAINGTTAKLYFYNNIIGMETVNDDLTATRLVGANVGYAALTWFIIWLCIAFGESFCGRHAICYCIPHVRDTSYTTWMLTSSNRAQVDWTYHVSRSSKE